MLFFIGAYTGSDASSPLIQIHLMLFFINSRSERIRLKCFIQIHLMLFFIPDQPPFCGPFFTFKYISCYSLSASLVRSKGGRPEFKYISCYSLSLLRLHSEIKEGHSNTSHVILYHVGRIQSMFVLVIQIHLMLFFISSSSFLLVSID